MPAQKSYPLVAVVMGSASDWDTMRHSVELLDKLGVPNEHQVLSAHRSPDATADFARKAADRGLRVIIAGAGAAAHLAGAIAGYTWLPVLGVNRANAGGRSRRRAGDRRSGREKCRAPCRQHSCALR